jgi:hypothetical protein
MASGSRPRDMAERPVTANDVVHRRVSGPAGRRSDASAYWTGQSRHAILAQGSVWCHTLGRDGCERERPVECARGRWTRGEGAGGGGEWAGGPVGRRGEGAKGRRGRRLKPRLGAYGREVRRRRTGARVGRAALRWGIGCDQRRGWRWTGGQPSQFEWYRSVWSHMFQYAHLEWGCGQVGPRAYVSTGRRTARAGAPSHCSMRSGRQIKS